jgi:hypothetical protein
MEMPTVRNVARDEQRNITYIFMAYRAMTREEMLMGVGALWQQRKKPKKGMTLTVMTAHGATG